MTEKIYGKVVEKHKNSVFQILKIGKAFNRFDFNSTLRKKNTRGKSWQTIQVNSPTYLFSI